MRASTSLATAALGLLVLIGCTDANSAYRRPASSETTTVVRDAYGNPLSSSTTVRDANGNIVTNPSAAPVYSGSTAYPGAPAYPSRNCEATPLHQDRPGGSDYNPYRGAPSC
jgi:hypothetical protein